VTWVWLEEAAILAVHEQQIVEHGGSPGVRDLGLLRSALARPQHRDRYEKPDIADLAAAYGYGPARNHPFIDGNKRIALIATETFLIANGSELSAADGETYAAFVQIAAGELTEQAFAGWIRDHLVPLPR